MTPEEHRDAAEIALAKGLGRVEVAAYHATMGILESLLQMEICGHGTRGFCKDCVRNEFFGFPISVREVGND